MGGIVKLRKCVAVAPAFLTLPNLRSCVLAMAFAKSEDEHEWGWGAYLFCFYRSLLYF